MKRFVIVVLILIVLALALPVSNLVVGLPGNTLTKVKTDDPQFAKAAAILGKKCVNCHTAEYTLPFYAQIPPAKQIIEKDIHDGTRYINFIEALFPPEAQPVSEVTLAKTEQSLVKNNMPPMRYVALHWDGGLSRAERDDILAWIYAARAKHYATGTAAPEFANEIVQPLPAVADLPPAKVALGEKIFNDKRLSKDNSLACAGCHDLAKGGTDQEKVSTGVGDAKGGINAPTVYNALFNFTQFWDGRAANLEEQADGPPNNPIEMASSWPEIISKFEQDPAFTQEFQAIYPDGYKRDNFLDAIATFERTLITPGRLDKYLEGDANALTADERKGYELFKQHDCATCHVGKILGGQSFELMGRKADYFKDRGNITEADYGRYSVTKKEEDKFKLKVPTLRNIALTFPYLHDATTDDLSKVIEVMAKYQVGTTLSKSDTDFIAKFLHALTGEYAGKQL